MAFSDTLQPNISLYCWHWINRRQSQLANWCSCQALSSEDMLTIPMCPDWVHSNANLATFISEQMLELQCGLECSFKVVQEQRQHTIFFLLFLKSCSSSLLFNCNYFNENIIITPREALWIYFSPLISFLNPWPPNFLCYSSASRATELIRSIWGCGKSCLFLILPHALCNVTESSVACTVRVLTVVPEALKHVERSTCTLARMQDECRC